MTVNAASAANKPVMGFMAALGLVFLLTSFG
jgi:hypothetical protein